MKKIIFFLLIIILLFFLTAQFIKKKLVFLYAEKSEGKKVKFHFICDGTFYNWQSGWLNEETYIPPYDPVGDTVPITGGEAGDLSEGGGDEGGLYGKFATRLSADFKVNNHKTLSVTYYPTTDVYSFSLLVDGNIVDIKQISGK